MTFDPDDVGVSATAARFFSPGTTSRRAARDMRPGHLALRSPGLWRYREVLPVDNPEERLMLGEGFTPSFPSSGSETPSAFRLSS